MKKAIRSSSREDELQTELVKARDVEASLRKELEIWQLAEHISSENLNVAEILSSLENAERERDFYKEELEALRSYHEGVHLRSEKTAAELKAAVSTVDRLEDREQDYIAQVKDLTASRDIALDEASRTREAFEFARNECMAVKQQLDQHQSTEHELEFQIQALQQELATRKKELERARQALREEASHFAIVQERLTEVTSELEAAVEERNCVISELTRVVAVSHPLEEEVAVLRKRVLQLENEAESLRDTQASAAACRSEIERVSAEHKELQRLYNDVLISQRASEKKAETALKGLAVERGRANELEAQLKSKCELNDESEAQLLRRLQAETASKENALQNLIVALEARRPETAPPRAMRRAARIEPRRRIARRADTPNRANPAPKPQFMRDDSLLLR